MIFGKHINKYYIKYIWMLLFGIISLATVDIIQLRIPEIYGKVIDGLDAKTEMTLTVNTSDVLHYSLTDLCFEMLIVVAVMVVGRFLWRICFFGSAIKVESDLRDEMFDHCKDLSQNFYQTNKVGNIMSYYTNDLDTINECFGDGTMMMFDALVLGTMAIYKMARINLMMTAFSLIPMLFLCGIAVVVEKSLQSKWELRQEAYSEMSDYTQERFSGIAVIKAFVLEMKEIMTFRKINEKNEKTNVDFTKARVLLDVLVTLFVDSVICIILGIGGWLAYKGEFSAGKLVEFISYFSSVIWPVMAVSSVIEMRSRGKASLKRIAELLDTPNDVCDKEGVTDPGKIKGEIEFRHLTYRYPASDHDNLTDVSVKISAGESVGIIGRTGSGKTTFVDLILRTYNVADGTLFIDGHDVNTIPISSVRNAVAYVPQDNFLFSDTIGKNIAFASGGVAEEEEIRDVARLAAVDDNIMEFADGYKTVLGERGVTVSGGQKQRISIARALLKNAPILVLDDSVSAVDTETEKHIIASLHEKRAGMTTLLIAHRISSIEQMDKVLFMERGHVIDFGTHSELYARCPAYHKMVELQRLEDEIGGKNA